MMAVMEVVVLRSYRDIWRCNADLAVTSPMGRVMDLDEFFDRRSMGGMSRPMMVVTWGAFGCEGNPTHVSLETVKNMHQGAEAHNQTAMVVSGYVKEVQTDEMSRMRWEYSSAEAV
jgi:hypothetical protein